jgi:hypothetical protein
METCATPFDHWQEAEMEENSTPPLVSMPHVPRASSTKSRRSSAVSPSWIPRPAYIAIAFVLILTIGWGAFHILGRSSRSDEDAEMADLEGFNDEPESLGTPEPQTDQSSDNSSHASGEQGAPWQTAAAPIFNGLPSSTISEQRSWHLERTPLAANSNPSTTSGAWLIGTIEADDGPERIALPPRVSQTAADGPLFR